MKKLVLILLLFPLLTIAQVKKPAQLSKKAIATENVKRWFKSSYVAEKFKDPYSYRLMKIELVPYTKAMDYKQQITELSEEEGNAATGNAAIIRMYKQMLATGSKEFLAEYEKYFVVLDAYGKNSYGAEILGKYRFYVDLKGNSLSGVVNLNDN